MRYKSIKIFSILILIILFINLNIGFVFAAVTPEQFKSIKNEYRANYDLTKLENIKKEVEQVAIQLPAQTDPNYNEKLKYQEDKNELIRLLNDEINLRKKFKNYYTKEADNLKIKMDAKLIKEFLSIEYQKELDKHGVKQTESVLKAWENTLIEACQKGEDYKDTLDEVQKYMKGKGYSPKTEIDLNDKIYQQPSRNDTTSDGKTSLDDMINDADSFINSGNKLTYNETALQNFSKSLYNIAVAVGIIVAVIVGGIIGIKLMSSNIETQVQAKKLLVPYVAGCVIVFGGFAIWKLVVTILQTV